MDALLVAEIGETATSSTAAVTARAEQAQPQPIQEIGKGKAGPGRGRKTGANSTRFTRGSTDAAYLTARIARDRPDILDRMKEDRYPSVRAASRISLRAVRPYTTPADARYL